MELSQLQDFHPSNSGLAAPVQELLADDGARRARVPCERDAFLALLAGVPALRSVPGLPAPENRGGLATLPRCASEMDAALYREYLRGAFGISNKEDLLKLEAGQHCNDSYLDFEKFWEGRAPAGAVPEEKADDSFFIPARDFSAQFYPVVGHLGYLAWDISERMGLLRSGLACGLLTREEFDPLADELCLQAQAFHSWEEYAASLVCGAMYAAFAHGVLLPDLMKQQSLWLQLVCMLLADKSAWGGGFWYTPEREKNYRLWPSEMRMYLLDWDGPNGCFVTDRISVDGCKVGWCCREDPEDSFPDSGWRFFSGDESEEYIADISHTGIMDLNEACNFDPDILPLLNAPYHSAFVREEGGAFRPEPFDLSEN